MLNKGRSFMQIVLGLQPFNFGNEKDCEMTQINPNLPGAEVHNAMQLTSIFNMQHFLSGGWNTEYSLYTLSDLLDSNNNTMADRFEGATEILNMASAIDWSNRNRVKQNTNEDIIVGLLYCIANKIIIKRPDLFRKISVIMKNLEQNNASIINQKHHRGHGEISEFYTNAEKQQDEQNKKYTCFTNWYENYKQGLSWGDEFFRLPELMEEVEINGRPNSSDISIMLTGLREVYNKNNEFTEGLITNRTNSCIKTILKKLCKLGRLRPQYDKALKDNFVEYLGLSLSVFKDDKETLSEIAEYCESHFPEKSITIEAMQHNHENGYEY